MSNEKQPHGQPPNPNGRWQPSSEWREVLPLGLDEAAQLSAEERAPLEKALAEEPEAREEWAALEEALQPLRTLRARPGEPMPEHLATRVKAAVQAEVAAAHSHTPLHLVTPHPSAAGDAPALRTSSAAVVPPIWLAAAAAVMLAVSAGVWVAAMVGTGGALQGEAVRPATLGAGNTPSQPRNEDVVPDPTQQDRQTEKAVVEHDVDADEKAGHVAAGWPQAFEVVSRDEVRTSNDRIHGMRSLDGNHRAGGVRYATSESEPMGDASGTALPRGEVLRDSNARSASF